MTSRKIARGESRRRVARASGPPIGRTRSLASLRISESQAGTLALPYEPQSKPCVELAAIVHTATGQTRDCAFDPAHARKITLTMRTLV